MARFLDFTCAFKYRETPHSFAYFRDEDYLGSQHHQPGLSAKGRSGIRIQHCFNLLGVERSRDNTGWLLRQTAAYHSYDLVQGRALWVVIKGDNTMRRRLESATEESVRKRDTALYSVDGSFARTLIDHLHITQWCFENWETYAESLELEFRNISKAADHAPVHDTTESIAIIKPLDQQPAQSPGIIRKATRRLTSGFSTATQAEPSVRRVKHHRIEDLVQFDKLQLLGSVNKSLREATSAVAQNRRVLAQMKKYYWELVKSAGFKLHVPKSSLKTCKQAASEFITKISRLEEDLANYEGNLKTILHSVERTETMYNGIVQYQGKHFAELSAQSAEIMEVWTQEMHEKTRSMHVITVFTLIFLPGTFVAGSIDGIQTE
ncbi:hypothetical protein N0V84_001858 [Fusarium piperis]|uniref:CorA-like transporter domain-containing protein n=1 Tax=Fusarium piperis TaxID=1435070 RepID=A0A9W8WKS2_9HYPO|nr:hypothetical protein N0V84_001858 [Fusarium piperis]